VLLPTPQGCITPNRDMSLFVPAKMWVHAFRRPSSSDPAELHWQFALFEAGAGMRRTAQHGHQTGRDVKGGGGEQHPTSCCHPTSAKRSAVARGWPSREGAHTLPTVRSVRLAARLRNRTLTRADARHAISGRGHAGSALLADSCRVRPGSGCKRRWRGQRPTPPTCGQNRTMCLRL
jgi:hypothetical protein